MSTPRAGSSGAEPDAPEPHPTRSYVLVLLVEMVVLVALFWVGRHFG